MQTVSPEPAQRPDEQAAWARPAQASSRQPLCRPERGRRIAGVAVGIAQHLGLPVWAVRLAFVVTGLAAAGVIVYVFFWLAVPSGERIDQTPALARLAPRLKPAQGRQPIVFLAAGLSLVALAAVLLLSRGGVGIPSQWLWPAIIMLVGLGLAWSQLGRIDAGPSPRGVSLLHLSGALILVVVAIALFITGGADPGRLVGAVAAGIGVVAGVALATAPWWLRLIRALGDERAGREREAERADIAAHLHDSVLQTLAIIRSKADQPEQIRRLARAQERELRQWLYRDRTTPDSSLGELLRQVAGEAEDLTGVEIGIVLVGDTLPTAKLQALVGATREALLNAANHGRPPVSLYAELSGPEVTVYIKDRGEGFDLEAVPEDRLGVRESILGRVRRQGGQAGVTPAPGGGTEIRLTMPNANGEANGKDGHSG
ncbi:MAG: PspC domain-containing protein [Micrococcales bacterium]|nr:PspC domain-containing protein [Micrococcales bacterium]